VWLVWLGDSPRSESGSFTRQIFGGMVHVYPFELKLEDVWSVERQAHDHVD
jgi:hypothetical protein